MSLSNFTTHGLSKLKIEAICLDNRVLSETHNHDTGTSSLQKVPTISVENWTFPFNNVLFPIITPLTIFPFLLNSTTELSGIETVLPCRLIVLFTKYVVLAAANCCCMSLFELSTTLFFPSAKIKTNRKSIICKSRSALIIKEYTFYPVLYY